MHEHIVEITFPGCCWHFDHADILELTEVLPAVVVDFLVVVGLLVVVVVVPATARFALDEHLTGYTAEQYTWAILYCARIGANSP